jgi:diketogulonate reductase-like aldo/keto reductase
MLDRPLCTTKLPSAETVSALGLGTWYLAEDPLRRADEIAALRNRAALDIRLTDRDLAKLNRAFPPPMAKRPLEML